MEMICISHLADEDHHRNVWINEITDTFVRDLILLEYGYQMIRILPG